MRLFGETLIRINNWVTGLSNRARLRLVLSFFLLLLGSSCYKLVTSWQRLQEPLPKVSPQEMIKPMQEIFLQTKQRYPDARTNRDFARLDSLAKIYMDKKHVKQ